MRQRGNRREKFKVQSNGKTNGQAVKNVGKLGSNLDECSSNVKSEEERNIFPRLSPWVVCALTMAVRINYVCQPKNWWILHPDEIFQTLEVAHSEVYGYGFRTHEYLPAEMNTTDMRLSEVRMGMHSMRSFLLPRFFIMVSWLAGMLGYTGAPFVLWKVAHVVISSCLPLGVYRLSKIVFRSHDIGVIAAILIVTSTHLAVFGTHTLINSFIGTPLFCALSVLFDNMFFNHNVPSARPKQCDSDQQMILRLSKNHKENSTEMIPTCLVDSSSNVDETSKMNGISKGDANGNQLTSFPNGKIGASLLVTKSPHTCEDAQASVHTNGGVHNEPRLSCDRMLELSSPALSETSVESRDANMNIIREKPMPQTSRSVANIKSIFFASFLLVVCCYVRVDASLFVLVTSLPFINRKWFEKERLLPCICGAFVGTTVCVLDDFNSYGIGVITPYYWFQFNIVRDFSASVYGRMDWTWYFASLFYDNPGFAILTTISILVVVICSFQHNMLSDNDKINVKTLFRMCGSLLVLFILYSTQGHKELRFLYNFLVLVFIVCSFCIFKIANYVTSKTYNSASRIFIFITLIAFILSQWWGFPSSSDKSLKTWTYIGNTESHDVISCFDYISKQDDVTGVFTDQMVHMNGGYTVLHKNVPILGLVHYEFYEFNMETRSEMSSVDLISPKRNISLGTFTQTAEFISMYSTSYLLKLIITRRKYNYVILNANKKFLPLGFDDVFRTQTKRVLKFNPDSNQLRQLDAFASDIPIGTNATVLTYEASWLIKFHQYEVAKERLIKALELEPRYIEAHKLLALCYSKIGDYRASGIVMGKCMKLYNKKICYENLKRIILHERYNFLL